MLARPLEHLQLVELLLGQLYRPQGGHAQQRLQLRVRPSLSHVL